MQTDGGEVLARVQFEFTAADLRDVLLRSPSFQRLRQQIGRRLLIAAALATLLAGGALAWQRGSFGVPALACAVVAVWVAVRWSAWVDRHARANVQRAVERSMASASTATCIVELLPAQLCYRQSGYAVVWPWAQVRSVVDTGADVEVLAAPQGQEHLLLVRERAFATPAARAEFAAIAQRLLTAARGR